MCMCVLTLDIFIFFLVKKRDDAKVAFKLTATDPSGTYRSTGTYYGRP